MLMQKNKHRFNLHSISKVFCLLFYKTVRSLIYIRSKSRKTNSDTTMTLSQKFFAYFFSKK